MGLRVGRRKSSTTDRFESCLGSKVYFLTAVCKQLFMNRVLSRRPRAGTHILFFLKMKKDKKNAVITTLDGMMTFGKTDNGLYVLDFKATEYAELQPFTAGCRVQGMRNGDVYITEVPLEAPVKRNPRVFVGKTITVTRRDDGSYRLNFRPTKLDRRLDIARYATTVGNEVLWALTSLVGKEGR